ncbi:MAG: hypothetical protein QOI21_799 [Actinomycetota bacterium]|jgi:hypothetical protein|nr:hypothetical protein [Actinomycetota bacterium]
MGWQEELRQLDVELANGSISPESHRKQRDELLAVASGGGSASPVASPLRRPPGEQAQQWQSTNPGYQQATPPAQEPITPPPPPTPVPPRPSPAQPFTTDRRTTAPSPADQRHTDWLPHPIPAAGRIDSATVVRPAVMPPPPPTPRHNPHQGPQRPPGRRPSDNTVPLARKDHRRPVWLFIALGVVLVAALVAGGVWWIGTTSRPAASGNSAVEKSLPALPGTAGPNNSTVSVDRALELKLVGQHTADLMKANGAQEIIYRSSAEMADETYGYTLFVVRTPSTGDATKLAGDLTNYAQASGFTDMKLANTPANTALSVQSPQGTLGESWYASANLTVGLGISQLPTGDAAPLRERVTSTRNQLIGVLPRG